MKIGSFCFLTVKVLTRVSFSDHHPIMIALSNNFHADGGKQFRFESAWVGG